MRKSASEVIRNLEMRVARLEGQSSVTLQSKESERRMKMSFHTKDVEFDELAKAIARSLSKLARHRVPEKEVEDELHDFLVDYDGLLDWEADEDASVHDLYFEILEYHPLNLAGTLVVECACKVFFGEGDMKKITFQVFLDKRGVEIYGS